MLCEDASADSKNLIIKENIRFAMNKLLHNPEVMDIEYGDIEISGEIIKLKSINIKTKNSNFDNLNVNLGLFDFDLLEIYSKNLLDEKKIKVKKCKKVNLHMEISEESLNVYVNKKSEKIKIKKPVVKLQNNYIFLSGSFIWKIGRISFRTRGNFNVDKTKIYFHPRDFKINRMNLPHYIVKRALKSINPILDLKKFPFEINLKKIVIKDEKLIITSNDNKE